MVRRQKTAEASWDAETWRPYANIEATTIDWALRSNFVTHAIPGRVLADACSILRLVIPGSEIRAVNAHHLDSKLALMRVPPATAIASGGTPKNHAK
jgi:hypothetical protein